VANVSKGKPVVISGPSGAGKTSVLRLVFERCRVPLGRSVSATTRPPRPGEVDGQDYHFITDEEFKLRRERGAFVEYFQVFGHKYWYGTLRSEVTTGLEAGKWVILEIDVHGALAVMRQFPETISIFLRPSSREELERRLRGRGTENEESIQRRLAQADAELAAAGNYKYQVINDDLDRAVQEICDILTQDWERTLYD
jgi:guanylate kinase